MAQKVTAMDNRSDGVSRADRQCFAVLPGSADQSADVLQVPAPVRRDV